MNEAQGLFVTGAGRSGTSLLDKLLSAHPQIAVFSQPLPLLYVELKQEFLRSQAGLGRSVSKIAMSYPLNDLFDCNHIDPDVFTEFLEAHRLEPERLEGIMASMHGYSGQYHRPNQPIKNLLPGQPTSTSAFISGYLRVLNADSERLFLGSKETITEEYIPYFLACGTKVILCVRDPRDVVASVFTGKGPQLAGSGRPFAFVVRQWRKSVAFALAHQTHRNMHLVRYEDLVRNPTETLEEIANWLGCNAFPADVADGELRDMSGDIWTSNSSHRAVSHISDSSVGIHRSAISQNAVDAIEVLCEPEMTALGYLRAAKTTTETRRGILQSFEEICPAPRASLRAYVWDDALVHVELKRLEKLDKGRYEPTMHLSRPAFDALRCTTGSIRSSTRPVKTVHENRAATIIYNLARLTRPGCFLLPANICPEVPLAIAMAGCSFRFVDIDPETLCMCPNAALDAMQGDTTGVVYARTYGACFDISGFLARIKEVCPGILVIDDKCSCRPELDDDIILDPNTDAVVYSTGYAKYVDLGGGGFGYLRSELGYEKDDRTYSPAHAAAVRDHFRELAHACPDDRNSTSTLREVLDRWPHWLNALVPDQTWAEYRANLLEALQSADRHKAILNNIYRRKIPQSALLKEEFNTWRYNVRVAQKNELLKSIFDAGAFASGHYRPATCAFGGGPAPHADHLYDHIVNLFNDRYMDESLAEKIAGIVRNHIEQVGPPPVSAAPEAS